MAPMMMRMLKMAEPTIVPTPISEPASGEMSDTVDAASSGAEDPAAMNVAPATSSESWSTSQMISSAGTKKSSQIIAMPTNMKKTPRKYAMRPPANGRLSSLQLPPPERSLRPVDAPTAYSPVMGSDKSVRPEDIP